MKKNEHATAEQVLAAIKTFMQQATYNTTEMFEKAACLALKNHEYIQAVNFNALNPESNSHCHCRTWKDLLNLMKVIYKNYPKICENITKSFNVPNIITFVDEDDIHLENVVIRFYEAEPTK